MEEEDYNQEQNINKKNKHVCKFCSRSFPCGRSLGGHMRSHVINGDIDHHHYNNKFLASSSSTTAEKIKKMLSSSSSIENNNTGIGSEGYGLRENPKKTWRLTDSTSEDTSLLFCKDCGKGFQSWRALFGHMKCHSSEKVESMECDQDSSWTNNSASHSDNEEANAPSRRRRSKRTRTRYIAPAATTDSSVSEADEHEQEEVAMSLMMLSRDLSPWCGVNSVSESSKIDIHKKNKNKKLVNIGSEFAKLGSYLSSSNLSFKGKKSSEFFATESSKGVKLMNNSTVSVNGFSKIIGKDKKKCDLDSESCAFEGTTNNKYSSMKAKFWDSGSTKSNWVSKKPNSDAEFSIKSTTHNHKRGKFECTTCNKIFHSYQALGGHRASHKKIKGCSFASRNNDLSSENSIEFEGEAEHEEAPPPPPPSPTPTDTKTCEYAAQQVHEFGNGFERESKKGTNKQGHECPICLKVFSSGQALGGHKRSHMASASASESGNFRQTVVLEESSVPEIRDLLDLNLPVAEEDDHDHDEEEINGHASDSYTTWWENHKQEALVGLMSN
ncbi:hypothetical protein PIB30_039296 [Stylosanthes scabra]|uniref:C2H2-type domain-containing protein n=1 Tax=Stylosanthes scabra TaxID=79078 RepID=A0ABU6ZCY9_9FABA|nr:hypothetical protein [Stylosanthes scabra]